MISVNEEIFPIRPRFANQYNLGLVLTKLGNPERLIPTINVVGTNGKGSTSAYVSQGLKAKYEKVGLFISPAFLFHNERIQINNQPISDEDLRHYLKKIDPWIEEYNLTFFEIWTLMMILYFVDQKVDVAVIEAGIGGMKDATNVMSNQLMVLLTSVSYDHTEILGSTIEEILNQKIGITRENSLLLISADNRRYQNQINQILQTKKFNFEWTDLRKDEVLYQEANLGLAQTCLKRMGVSERHNQQLIRPLGRFTILKQNPKLILDGAHNLDGIQQLIASLQDQKIKPMVLYAASAKKDYQAILKLLDENFDQVYITTFDHFKAWNLTPLDYKLKVEDWKKFLSENKDKNIVVCGSLYFIPQVYEWYCHQQLKSDNYNDKISLDRRDKMSKNLKNVVEIYDGKFDQMDKLLSQGKTVLAAVEVGPFMTESLKKGYSDHFQAKVELKERKENAGVCGCGKPANALVYFWRD